MAAKDPTNGGRPPQGAPTGVDRSLDSVARGLADGSVSRRKALRLLGAALIGAALMPLFPEEAQALTNRQRRRCIRRGGTVCSSGTRASEVCCPSGTTCLAGPTCCPSAQVCGSACCQSGQTCVNGTCCPSSQVCGSTCCQSDQTCVNGTCATLCTFWDTEGQKHTEPCPSGTTCCPGAGCYDESAGEVCCTNDGGFTWICQGESCCEGVG